jgi:redox-sensitive bicupin YhaK (pirin superfamily)
VVSGNVRIEHEEYLGGVMAIAAADKAVSLTALDASRVMVIGGDPVGRRHIWWNFVSSSKARMAKAKQDWQEGRFEMVPRDDEFIPLPE